MIAAIWKNDLRHWLIWINFVAFVGLIVYLIWRGAVAEARATEEKTPANLTPFLDDEDLEGRRLERVQGWALIFAAVVAIALPLYWLREPDPPGRSRRTTSTRTRSTAARCCSRTRRAPSTTPAMSLQCANCHGAEGRRRRRAAPRVNGDARSTGRCRRSTPRCCASKRTPTASSQSRRQPQHDLRRSRDIITYGRPGTPMQAWGVVGGGPKNDQSIADLVAYIESIQLTPEKSQQQATEALDAGAVRRPGDRRAPST